MLEVLKVQLPLAKRPSNLITHLRFMFVIISMNRIQVKHFKNQSRKKTNIVVKIHIDII